jgi:hypothetical protein
MPQIARAAGIRTSIAPALISSYPSQMAQTVPSSSSVLYKPSPLPVANPFPRRNIQQLHPKEPGLSKIHEKHSCIDSFSTFQTIAEKSGLSTREFITALTQETAKQAASEFGESVGESAAKAILERYFKETLPVIIPNTSNTSNNVPVSKNDLKTMYKLPSYCECDQSKNSTHYCHKCGVLASTMNTLDGGKRRKTIRRRRGKANKTRLRRRLL